MRVRVRVRVTVTVRVRVTFSSSSLSALLISSLFINHHRIDRYRSHTLHYLHCENRNFEVEVRSKAVVTK